jgi:hypothetical protein
LRIGALRRRFDSEQERVRGGTLEIVLVGVPGKAVVRISDQAAVFDHVGDHVNFRLLRKPELLAGGRLKVAEQPSEGDVLGGRRTLVSQHHHAMLGKHRGERPDLRGRRGAHVDAAHFSARVAVSNWSHVHTRLRTDRRVGSA